MLEPVRHCNSRGVLHRGIRSRTPSLTWPQARRSASTSGAARSSRTYSTLECQVSPKLGPSRAAEALLFAGRGGRGKEGMGILLQLAAAKLLFSGAGAGCCGPGWEGEIGISLMGCTRFPYERQCTAHQNGSSLAATMASQPPSRPWASWSISWSAGTFLFTLMRTSSQASFSSCPGCFKVGMRLHTNPFLQETKYSLPVSQGQV